jgi:hypothetical protein
MTDEPQAVTIHIPGEQVGKVASLYEEWSCARDGMLEEVHRSLDIAIKLTEMRSGFFEKLILLATGSFALSLTFLGSLNKHAQGTPLSALYYLKGSWVLLITCILFGWLHNLYRTASIERLSLAAIKTLTGSRFAVTQTFLSRASSIFKDSQTDQVDLREFFALGAAQMKELADDAVKQTQKFSDDASLVSRHADRLGSITILSIVFAFILLLIFVFKNAALL